MSDLTTQHFFVPSDYSHVIYNLQRSVNHCTLLRVAAFIQLQEVEQCANYTLQSHSHASFQICQWPRFSFVKLAACEPRPRLRSQKRCICSQNRYCHSMHHVKAITCCYTDHCQHIGVLHFNSKIIATMSEDIPLLYLIAILLHWVYRSRVFGLGLCYLQVQQILCV